MSHRWVMGREARSHEIRAIMTQVQTYGRGTWTMTPQAEKEDDGQRKCSQLHEPPTSTHIHLQCDYMHAQCLRRLWAQQKTVNSLCKKTGWTEKIVDERHRGRGRQYLVRWHGEGLKGDWWPMVGSQWNHPLSQTLRKLSILIDLDLDPKISSHPLQWPACSRLHLTTCIICIYLCTNICWPSLNPRGQVCLTHQLGQPSQASQPMTLIQRKPVPLWQVRGFVGKGMGYPW